MHRHSRSDLDQEARLTDKDAGVITEVMEQAGISRRIAKFVPFAVIKG